MTELEQLESVERHFNNILPLPLPKNKIRKCWRMVNTRTVLGTLKPLATVIVAENDRYIKKVIEAFGLDEKIEQAEKKLSGDYDITIAVKKGTNLISFTKSVEPSAETCKEWFVMWCIPINDQETMSKMTKTIKNQKTETPLLVIKDDLDR